MSKVSNSIPESNIKEDEKTEFSLWAKFGACLMYGLSSAGLTFVNKTLYEKYGF